MLIDWFTVGAQIINFLILVLLLKKFLYGPIIQVMAAREGKIQAQLTEADTRRRQAAAAESLAQQHLQDLENKRQALAAQVEVEVAQQKNALMESARQEVGQYRQGWLQSLAREKAALAQTIQNSCSLQAFTLARAILRELGDVSVEERCLQVFFAKLAQLSPADERAFRASLPESGQAAVVASPFPLTEPQQAQILAALQAKFGSQVTIQFQTDPGLIAGLEVKTRSQKIAWTAEHSLHNLQEKVMEQLKYPSRGGIP